MFTEQRRHKRRLHHHLGSSVIALHNLINNQISNREQEKANLPAPPKKQEGGIG
jgi:hypothetical protein